jgi:hypothetical protein
MKKLSFFAGICVLLLCSGVYSYSQTVDFSRGLPSANLNNDAGADRSNVVWGFYEGPGDVQSAAGDTFRLANSGKVTDIRVWMTSEGTQPLSNMWSNFTLFLGDPSGNILYTSAVGSVSGTGITITPTTYPGGAGYQSSSGNYDTLYQVDFLGAWNVTGGQDYTFFVGGTPTARNLSDYTNGAYDGVSPFLSASNAALSGTTPQDGANNTMYWLSYGSADPSNNGSGTWDSGASGGGWDKSSDINVEVLVPEGGSQILYLLLAGAVCFGALIVSRRMRSASAQAN